MEEALRAKLLGTAALAARVGRRVDWGIRSSADLPAVRLFEISGLPQMNLAGPSGWSRSRVQVETWGRTYKDARDLADIIGGNGSRGVIGVLTGMRAEIDGVRLRTLILGRRADDDTDTVGVLHRTALDVLVWHAAA